MIRASVSRPRLTALVGMVALGVACGPATTPVSQAPPAQGMQDGIPISSVTQAAPSVAAQAFALPATVDLKDPAIEVEPPDDVEAVFLTALTAEGVDAVAAVRLVEAQLVGATSDRAVQVAAVDPTAFRPFTPEPTAQSASVWERLHAGDVLVRHDVAHELGLELGGTILLQTDHAILSVRVGAFASNGAPPIADVIVPWELGAALGQESANRLFVAVQPDARVSRVERALVTALGGGKAAKRAKPRSQQAQLLNASGAMQLPTFTYTDNGDGTITIDGGWVREWIVGVDLPGLGRTYVNRLVAPQLLSAMREVEQAGLLDHFDRRQFGGGWVARHIDWDPRKSLSMHAWGLAVDFNTRDNALGAEPKMDRRIVEIFDRWGFAWGGRWSRPDGMHFELAKIVTAS